MELLFVSLSIPKKLVSMGVKTSMGTIRQQDIPIECRGRLDRQASIRVNLAAEDMKRPCQGATLLPTMATRGSISAMVVLCSLMVKPSK
jgi:hypothetical protein